MVFRSSLAKETKLDCALIIADAREALVEGGERVGVPSLMGADPLPRGREDRPQATIHESRARTGRASPPSKELKFIWHVPRSFQHSESSPRRSGRPDLICLRCLRLPRADIGI
jgi:hypothetical protein